MPLLAPISVGELFDKISILELKRDAIADPARRANIERELAELEAVRHRGVRPAPGLSGLFDQIRDVNRRLWQIEDALRAHERAACFDARFIELARSVYRENDRRATLKRRISEVTGSEIVEEKFYGE